VCKGRDRPPSLPFLEVPAKAVVLLPELTRTIA
jgi:hypothetical protein